MPQTVRFRLDGAARSERPATAFAVLHPVQPVRPRIVDVEVGRAVTGSPGRPG